MAAHSMVWVRYKPTVFYRNIVIMKSILSIHLLKWRVPHEIEQRAPRPVVIPKNGVICYYNQTTNYPDRLKRHATASLFRDVIMDLAPSSAPHTSWLHHIICIYIFIWTCWNLWFHTTSVAKTPLSSLLSLVMAYNNLHTARSATTYYSSHTR